MPSPVMFFSSALSRVVRLGAFFLVVAITSPALRAEVPVVIVYEDPAGEGFYDPSPRTPEGGNSGNTLGEQRRNVFEAAVYQWSESLSGTVPIEIRAIWVSQGEGKLASASPANYSRDWQGAPIAGRWYPTALANQLAGTDLIVPQGTNDGSDIHVFCNADWDNGVNAGNGDSRTWYYGFDGGASDREFDFYSIVLHELGHGLGFLSFLNEDGSWVNGAPTVFDQFLIDSTGSPVIGMTQAQRAAINTSDNVFVGGPFLRAVNQNNPARIHAPLTYKPGSTLSHFDESTYSKANSLEEMMTPVSSYATHTFGVLAVAMLRDLGYYFADNAPPTASINFPGDERSYQSVTTVTGTATDQGFVGGEGAVGLREVRVALSRSSDGSWYRWSTGGWDAEFDFVDHVRHPAISLVPISQGPRDWSASLPDLIDGGYQVHVMAVDQLEQGGDWVARGFRIDNVVPQIDFGTWEDGETVFSLADVGGNLTKPADVRLYIIEPGSPPRYWNGTTQAWTTNGNEPGASLSAGYYDGEWFLSVDAPGRGQTRGGDYILNVKATDEAGNEDTAQIVVTRSARDSTLPEITIHAPLADQVVEERQLPLFEGLAVDEESGISGLDLVLLRATGEGFLSWNGTIWSETVTNLPAIHDPATRLWRSDFSLPEGGDLPNGEYQLQVLGRNREEPAGTRGVSVAFVVDYHPTFTWTGLIDSNWSDPRNWQPQGIPGPDAIAAIHAGSANAYEIGTVNLHQLKLTGGQLTAQGLQVKKLNISGGTLVTDVTNLLPEVGSFEWTGGAIRGVFGFLPGTTVTISGPNRKTLGSGTVVHNYTTVTWSGPGPIYNYGYYDDSRATWNNYAGSAFVAETEGEIFSYDYNPSTFLNQSGARIIAADAGTTSLAQIIVKNQGELDACVGTLHLAGTQEFQDGGRLTGEGQISFTTGALQLTGTTMVDGVTWVYSGGTLTGDPVDGGRIATSNGGLFQWTGGYFGGIIKLLPGADMRIEGIATKHFGTGAVFENFGNIVWSEGQLENYAYSESQRAIFSHMSGSTFSTTGETEFAFSYNPSFLNIAEGARLLRVGAGTTKVGWICNNHGEVRAEDGVLVLAGGGGSGGVFGADVDGQIRFTLGSMILETETAFRGPGVLEIAGAVLQSNEILDMGRGDDAARVVISSGELRGAGELVGEGRVTWTGGTIGGTLTLALDMELSIEGDGRKTLGSGAVLTNEGRILWSGAGVIYNYAYFDHHRATLINAEGGLMEVSRDGTLFTSDYQASFFKNAPGARLVKTGGEGELLFDNFMLENGGEIHVDAGSLKLGGSARLDAGTEFRGPGTVVFAGSITATASFPATANLLLESGSFTAERNALEEPVVVFQGPTPFSWTGGSLGGAFIVGPDASLQISGIERKTLGAGALLENRGRISYEGTGAIFNNGYHEIQRATINNESGGVFAILNDGEVFAQDYHSSLFHNKAGATVVKEAGAGAAVIDRFIFTHEGEVRVEEGTLSIRGEFKIGDGARFSGSGRSVSLGAAELSGTMLVEGGGFELAGGVFTGRVDAAATVVTTGAARFFWTNGGLGGVLHVAPAAEVWIDGPAVKAFGAAAVLNNAGRITWTEGNLTNNAYHLVHRATINNLSGGHFLADGDLLLTSDYNPAFFNNHAGAVFEKTGSGTTTTSRWIVNNAGTIDVSSGEFHCQSELELADSSLLRFVIRGREPGSHFGRIAVAGKFNPGGTLLGVLEDDFLPTMGDTFGLVGFGERAGEFGSVGLTGLSAGTRSEAEYGPTTFALVVVEMEEPVRIGHFEVLPDGTVRMLVNGPVAASLVVETSVDLIEWTPIQTIVPFTGTADLEYAGAGQGESRRFYRAVLQF